MNIECYTIKKRCQVLVGQWNELNATEIDTMRTEMMFWPLNKKLEKKNEWKLQSKIMVTSLNIGLISPNLKWTHLSHKILVWKRKKKVFYEKCLKYKDMRYWK